MSKQLFWNPVLRMEKIRVIIRSKFRPFASCVEIKGTNDCLCWISWNRSGVLQKRVQLVIWAVSKYLFRSIQCCCWCHFTAQDHLFVEGNDFNSRVDGFQCGGKGGGTCTIPTSGYWAALRRQSPFWSLYVGQQQQKILNLLACMYFFYYKICMAYVTRPNGLDRSTSWYMILINGPKCYASRKVVKGDV